MDVEIRAINDDEFLDYHRAMGVGFGYQPTEQDIELSRKIFERDRSLGAFDHGQAVATAGVFSFELTMPGREPVKAGGVTAVTVTPTHRRRGILTEMMGRMLDDISERGEPVAMLWASESVIYGRFGYGAATFAADFEIERAHAKLAHPVEVPGRFRIIGPEEAAKILPSVFDRFRAATAGAVSRPPGWWSSYLADPEWGRGGASSRFYVVHESVRNEADGFASYRIKRDWSDGLPRATAIVDDMVAIDEIVRTGLWQVCLDIDLTAKVVAVAMPPDEPLRWRLADPRRLMTRGVADALWVRPVDVPTALEARAYPVEGRLILDVHDRFRPDWGGRFEVEGGADGAVAKRSRRKADLALSTSDLGALLLGGVTATTLARAGRVQEQRRGALALADAMFGWAPAPWCSTHF